MYIKDVITPLDYIIINNNRIKSIKYSLNYLLVKCKSNFDQTNLIEEYLYVYNSKLITHLPYTILILFLFAKTYLLKCI